MKGNSPRKDAKQRRIQSKGEMAQKLDRKKAPGNNHNRDVDQVEPKTNAKEGKKFVVIGDSMLYNIQGRGITKKHNVTVCANPGATTRDILDHFKPILRKKPDVIIVQCGTNDLTSQEKTVENLQELVRMAKAESPDTELVLSSSITRRDKAGLQQKFNELKADVKCFSHNSKMKLIDNSNLEVQSLAGDNCT